MASECADKDRKQFQTKKLQQYASEFNNNNNYRNKTNDYFESLQYRQDVRQIAH